MNKEETFSHEESLKLINTMINKAKNSYHDTGIGPMFWGVIISFCSIITFLQMRYQISFPFNVWWLTLIAVLPQILIVNKEKRMNKARTYDEVVMDYVWTCFGISIGLLIFINISVYRHVESVMSDVHNVVPSAPGFQFGEYTSAYFLLLYGFPTIITGGFRKFKPMLFGGIFCWVVAIVSVYTNAEIDMLLVAAAAIFAWLIPGLILWQKYQKRKQANV